ncbi:Histone H2A [Musa troglodytarum]|uniref:Histone H2A n=1 Tax=Musa troglodytarum TaxID=320322 RepID=A0A9E7GQX7_9LILI|nr:Histone H2A [Musa troglodytarum]
MAGCFLTSTPCSCRRRPRARNPNRPPSPPASRPRRLSGALDPSVSTLLSLCV